MRASLSFLFALLIAAGAAADNFVVDPATVCHCDAGIDSPCLAAAERWRRAVDTSIEIDASDFKRGEFIGTACESEGDHWWTNVWKPVDGFKHTLVGTLHHFNWNIGDDEDWNLHVIPDAAFSELITIVETRHPGSILKHRKCGEPSCMEAEISPDKQLWDNPWFLQPGTHASDRDDNGFSVLEGRTIGFYGPWVVDANHCSKAEIHPVPMIWWKDHWENGFGSSGPFDVFWLMLMQDNTGRFDDRDNFDCGGDTPPGWEPWTQSPVSGQFSVAFVVDPAGEVVTFSIDEIFNRFVMTRNDPAAMADADDGAIHDLQFGGRVVVSVHEDQPNDDDLGVTFTGLCLRPDGKLQGFVTIRSQVGGNDDIDEEGFHVLFVTRAVGSRPVPPRPPSVELDGFVLTSNEIRESLRSGKGAFLGDLELSIGGTTDAVSSVELASGGVVQKIDFTQDPKTGAVLLPSVPLTNGRAYVTTKSGKTSSLEIPAIVPNPRIRGTWSGKDLLELTLETRYAAFREDELSDRQSAFAAYVTDALIRRDPKTLDALFATEKPLAAAWSIDAIDTSTGEAVAVDVEITQGSFGVETARVRVPASKGVVEVRAGAIVTDANGQSGTFAARFPPNGPAIPTACPIPPGAQSSAQPATRTTPARRKRGRSQT